MPTALITHPACIEHEPGPLHPESPQRLSAVLAALLLVSMVAGTGVLLRKKNDEEA